jgi:alpha-1,2-mannosyltransferase
MLHPQSAKIREDRADMTLHTKLPLPSGQDTFFKLALAFGVMVAGLEIGYLLYSPMPYDPVGYLVGRDFVNTWVGGELALTRSPQTHFAVDAYNALLAEKFGARYPLHIWSYPPHLLLFTWPFALLPYVAAYVLYCAAGLILYLAVVTDGQRRADHLVLLALAPAVTVNIWCGQNGFLTTAMLIGGLNALDRRPILSGALFGLLSIKPQLGVLVPLMLALTGRWRTIFAAVITIALLLALTSLVFGPDVWTAYVKDAMPVQTKVFLRDYENFMVHMPTAFMNARVAGVPLSVAAWLQALLSLAAVLAVVWTFWRRRDVDLSNALLVTATFLVTPYAFNYDMVIFGWVIIKLMDRGDNAAADYGLMLAVWATPLLTVPLGIAGLPLSCLPMLGLGARLLWRLRSAHDVAARRSRPTAAPQLRACEERELATPLRATP